jgi:hypothetical protein
VFYLALGYAISCLPFVLLAKGLSSAIVPGVDRPVGGLVLLPAAALAQDDHRHTAAVIQHAAEQRLAEQFL